MGWSRILYLFVYVLFLPHSSPVMNISTKANFSLHCSIPVPARNLDTSCFCVELQLIYMVNVLSTSKPGHGPETTARQQHDQKKIQQNWTSLKLTQRPHQTPMDVCRASGSDSIALVTAAIAVPRCGERASALCSATSKPPSWGEGGGRLHCLDTILLKLEATSRSLLQKKHVDTTRSVANAWASSAAPLWSSCINQPKLANYDERGQEEVIFGLTAHCEQLDLVAVGLTGQQLVIKTCATTGTSTP